MSRCISLHTPQHHNATGCHVPIVRSEESLTHCKGNGCKQEAVGSALLKLVVLFGSLRTLGFEVFKDFL
jgi:hypothetical protein